MVGRETELEDLKTLIEQSEKVVVVNGLGGIGKTTLAKRYLAIHNNDYDHIAFIEVSVDEEKGQSNFISAVANDPIIHENLGITLNPKLDETKRTRLIMNGLQQLEGNNLLFIDNATGDLPTSQVTLPTPPRWKVLVTSRVRLDQFALFALDSLSMEDGKILFEKYAGKVDGDALEELLELIDCHTLTIELLAKTYAKSLTMKNVGELVDYLKSNQLHHERLAKEITSEHANNKEITAYSHLLSAFILTDLTDREKWLLKQFTVLPPKPLTVEFLFDLLETKIGEEQEELSDLLQSLHKKGWLQESRRQEFFIHRMIQSILSYQLEINFQDSKNLVEGVTELLSFDQAKDNPIDKFQWVEWGENLLHWFKHSSEPEVFSLMNNLALRYQDLGDYQKAALLLEETLDSDLKNFGENHSTVARTRSNLAVVYSYLGDYQKATELLEKAVESDLQNFGGNHSTVARTRSNLALSYLDQKDYQKAVKLLEKVLTSDLQNFGENHPTVARTRSNLAVVYRKLGDYKKSIELHEKALEFDLKKFGESHPKLATRRSNLALTYQDLGKYQKAADLLEIALASELRSFGENHPNVARCQLNLGAVLINLKEYQEAHKLIERAFKIFIDRFGASHPDTERTKGWLDKVKGLLAGK
ncbi:tetratricopeptide repeat protein [Fulvivirgaceae bacterium BMA12]|uniref:Tetratricopeptide repeat protein n=1 Tax=Agaribacillus aureus TaxID=3051825 RepID=A0ABT8L2E6_9BACT|nr:tetratricopeptide repeat protein [Fulvivirgaceae bacterium BMA12]